MKKFNSILCLVFCCLLSKANSDQDMNVDNLNSQTKLLEILKNLNSNSVEPKPDDNPMLQLVGNTDNDFWKHIDDTKMPPNTLFQSPQFDEIDNTPKTYQIPQFDSSFIKPLNLSNIPKIDFKAITFEQPEQDNKQNIKFLERSLIHSVIIGLVLAFVSIIIIIVRSVRSNSKNTSPSTGQSNVAFSDQSDSNTFKILFPSSTPKYEKM